MIDVKDKVYTALFAIGLPVHYESLVTPDTITPCITYFELDNTDLYNGDTIEYSNITFQIKVWSDDAKILSSNAILIDAIMKPLGYTREFGSELFLNGMGQKILRYSSIGYKK